MKRDEITLEVCSNREWLRDMAGLNLDAIDDGLEEDAAAEYGSAICAKLEAAGYKVCCARGQRGMFHGWNGANTFAHKLGPVGTFDDLTREQQEEVFSLIASAQNEIEARYAKA